MKKLLGCTLAFALLTTPLFAAKTATVTIPEAVTVGAKQIAAGEYKLSYDGSGTAVKVTLAKHGASPIVLDAKLVTAEKGRTSVTFDTVNGARVLEQIELSSGTLIFETTQTAGQ